MKASGTTTRPQGVVKGKAPSAAANPLKTKAQAAAVAPSATRSAKSPAAQHAPARPVASTSVSPKAMTGGKPAAKAPVPKAPAAQAAAARAAVAMAAAAAKAPKPAAKTPAAKAAPAPKVARSAPAKPVAARPVASKPIAAGRGIAKAAAKPAPVAASPAKAAPQKAVPQKPAAKQAEPAKAAPLKTAPPKALAEKPAPVAVRTVQDPAPAAVAARVAPQPKAPSHSSIETKPIVTTATANDIGKPTQAAAPKPAEAPPAARPAMPANGRPAPVSRAAAKEESFAEGDYVVYPTHGVGKVEKIAKEEIAGHHLELIHITFEENRMTLRVPVAKARTAGLRKLATRKMFDEALAVLKGRARIKRTMWSRRAQEYEAKINSGDPTAIAEVVRDLHRNAGQPDQSFSERQIYEAAMDRLAAELAALDQTDKPAALIKLGNFLKSI